MKPLIRRAAFFTLLARRDYSQREITQKLTAKGYSKLGHQTQRQSSLNLAKQAYINEKRFAENYIYWRQKKGYGPLRISMELQARGIAHEMIAEQLQITDNAWLVHARKVWQKHFKVKPSDFKLLAKQMRFLQYRGFTHEQIESVFG